MISKIRNVTKELFFVIMCLIFIIFYKIDCAAAVNPVNVQTTDNSALSLIDVPRLHKVQAFNLLKDSPDVISGTSGTCNWEIKKVDELNYTLEIGSGTLATCQPPNVATNLGGSNWNEDANDNNIEITKVKIDPGVSLPQDATGVFSCMPNVKEIQGLDNLDTSKTTNMQLLFSGCSGLKTLDLSSFDTSHVTNMYYMFYKCSVLTSLNVSSFNTSQVTNMSGMFFFCEGLTSLDVSNFDTSQTTLMYNMFSFCEGLASLDVSNFDTSHVTDMTSMFIFCSGLKTLDVSKFDTSKVNSMDSMFAYCSGLKTLDVSKFDTSKVTKMSNMFNSCRGLKTLDVSHFNTGQVTNMYYMFNLCRGLKTLDLSNFDTGQVTNMSSMFNSCSELKTLDVSHFNTSQVNNMQNMFSNCDSLTNLDLSSFKTIKVESMTGIFSDTHFIRQLTLGKDFKFPSNISLTNGSWPSIPSTNLPYVFNEGGLRYSTIGKKAAEFEWMELGTGDFHHPNGKGPYKPYIDSIDYNNLNSSEMSRIVNYVNSSDIPLTFVWKTKTYNAPPSVTFTNQDSNPITTDKPYTYPYDFRQQTLPPLKMLGTVIDEDSSTVTLSYGIDNGSNHKFIGTFNMPNGNNQGNKTDFDFIIDDQDDLKTLATPKTGGHTIQVYAQDSGIDGQPETIYPKESSQIDVPVAENAIVDFTYTSQPPDKKEILNPQTLVRSAATNSHKNDYLLDYGYPVNKYIPRYIWGKENKNLKRYIVAGYPDNLKSIDWGSIDWDSFNLNGYLGTRGNLKSTVTEIGGVKKVNLSYDDGGYISLIVPNLDFGSHIRQVWPYEYGLQSLDKKQLIVRDTNQSIKKSWKVYLTITKFINTRDPNKSLDSIFRYNDLPLDSTGELLIADGSQLLSSDSSGIDYNLSDGWYDNFGRQKLRYGPWLKFNKEPPEGTYTALATWTLKNAP